MVDVVTVWKRKRPAGHGRWRAYAITTDDWGTWAYTPAASTFIGTTADGDVETCDVAQDALGRGRHCVPLLPPSRWFVAQWVLGSQFLVNVDISTPPTRCGPDWSFDDLELDPYLLRDGTFGVDDEAEFAAACAAGVITDQERHTALLTVDALRDELTGASSSLLQTGRHYLEDAISRDLTPLVDVTA